MACLDTCVLLDMSGRGGRRKRESAERVVRTLLQMGETLAVSRFTEAELWVGIVGADQPDRERTHVYELLSELDMLEFDAAAARLFGEATAHLRRMGTPVGDMDVLIASVALANQHSLVTRNARHFVGIPELDLITY